MPSADQWLSLPEVAEVLDVRLRDVRTLISDRRLIAIRRGENNALAVTGGQIVIKDGEPVPLPALRGTLILLADSGFSDDEAFAFLYREDPELGTTPMQALLDGKHHAVRRIVAGLAF